MRRILVTAAGGILCRSLVKCLRKAEEPLHLIGVDMDPMYLPLCPLDETFLVPPLAQEEAYRTAIHHIVQKRNVDFVFPNTDQEIAIVSAHPECCEGKVWLPDPTTIARCQDKLGASTILRTHDIPTPDSVGLNCAKDVEALFTRGTPWWVRAKVGSGGKGARLCRSAEEAAFWINAQDGWGAFMASPYLPGRIYGWDSLWQRGTLLCSQLKERLRYGGSQGPTMRSSSTTAIRTVQEPSVEEIAERAVRALASEPDGMFAVDLREDPAGNPQVTEVNAGRFLTTSTILFGETGSLLQYEAMRLKLDGTPLTLPTKNPIPPEIYLLGGILTEARIVAPEAFAIPSWEEA